MLVTTLYVRLNPKMHFVKSEIKKGRDINTDEPYKVYDVWYAEDQPYYGIVDNNGRMLYVPSTVCFICDSKTKKILGDGHESED